MSYNGYCLFSTFKDPSVPIPPAVRAVVPINTTSRLSTMSYRDGPLHLELIIRWSGYLWALTRDTTSLLKLVRVISGCSVGAKLAWSTHPQDNTTPPENYQGLSLLHGCTFLGYGFFDHPRFTRAVRHLPVHEITSACRTILGRETRVWRMHAPFPSWVAQYRLTRPDTPHTPH